MLVQYSSDMLSLLTFNRSTRQQLDKLDLAALSLEFPTFVFSTSVRDLGVILDQELSFVEHITALTRSCFYHFRQLLVVSRSLSLLLLPP